MARLTVGGAFASALFAAAAVDACLLFDPRYEAEAWLQAHVAPGDTLETYGHNVYMPRFPANAHVERVGPSVEDHRNPMPGVNEVLGAYDEADARAPRFIVVSDGWAWRYLIDKTDVLPGRVLPQTQLETTRDSRATAYFHALTENRYGPYRLVHVARWESHTWPPLFLHGSTCREMRIYERMGVR